MKIHDKMNTYLANLAVLNTKLHNLHWNVEGKQFMRVHNFTEDLYNDFFEKYDEVAEMIKMKGEYPLVKLSEYQDSSTIEELDSKSFSEDEVLKEILSDLKEMKKLATEIRNAADEIDDFEVVAEFEDQVADYSQNIWFIESMLA